MKSYQSFFTIYFMLVSGIALQSCSHRKVLVEMQGESKNQDQAKHTNSINQSEVPSEKLLLPPSSVNSSPFKMKTKDYGLLGTKSVHTYAVDFNNDHLIDLVLLEDFYSVPKFFRFNKKLKQFELIDSPFHDSIRASFMVFADFNRDSIMDVVVATLNQKNELQKSSIRIFKGLIKNNNLIYSEVKSNDFGINPVSSLNVFDFDLDGELDLFIGNWFDLKNKDRPLVFGNKLFKGNGFEFKNVSHLLDGENLKVAGQMINHLPTFGSTVCDVDKNGYPDILTNSSNGHANKLWMSSKNDAGEIFFKNTGKESGYSNDSDGALEILGGGNSFFSMCYDYNNDGLVDIVLGNQFSMHDPETKDRSAVLTGASPFFPPKFLRTEFYSNEFTNAKSIFDRRAIAFDYNLDHLVDMGIENSGLPPETKFYFVTQNKDHSFDEAGSRFGLDVVNPSGSVYLDINQDGWWDLIIGQSNTRAPLEEGMLYLFENNYDKKLKNSEHKNKLVKFYFRGERSNRQGLGASIVVQIDGKKFYFENNLSYGSLPSQNAEGFVLRLFNSNKLENIKVRWPYKLVENGRDKILELSYPFKKIQNTIFNSPKQLIEIELCDNGQISIRPKTCFKP